MGAIVKNGIVYGGSMDQAQSNWTETDNTSPAYIKNKPTLGSASAKDSTTTIVSGGTDLPTSGAVYTALQNVHIDVDTTLDTTSDNPIANSAVATALNGKVDAVNGKGLSTNDYTDADQSKLSNIAAGAEVNVQSNWNESDSDSDAFILNKPTLGTAAAKDSTTSVTESSTDLITSGAVYTALSGKVDTESGKGLSTNDYTTEEKTKLSGIATGAEVNVQSNWSETDNSSDAYILNKPTALSAFTNDSGFITNTVNNLTNYYAKTESYSKTEVDSMISAAKSGRFIYVATLPTTDIHTDAIYLVPKTVSQTDNVKDEYINLDGTTTGWEKIGDTQIDLSNYVQKSQTSGLIKNDGTIDTNTYATTSSLSDYIQKSSTSGLVKNDGTIDTSKHVSLQPTGSELTGDLQAKTWNGYTPSSGQYIWTDGENIYYSQNNNQYVLYKSTSTWNTKSWNSSIYPHGNYIWTDGENIYYSNSNLQYVLDKTTSTWSEKTWSGLTNFEGNYIWTDGENIYYSDSSNQYVLDKSTSTWNTKSWSGLTSFEGNHIWTDGENIYYSKTTNQYVLNKSTSTWNVKTWSGLTNFYGSSIWTDGENIYYSNGISTNQYVLNKSTSTWNTKTWSGGLSNIIGSYIWTDGENIYYSNSDSNYVFVTEPVYADGFVKSDGTIDTNTYLTSVPTATSSALGLVKPDNLTITVNGNGVISSSGGASLVKTRYTITATNWSNSVDASGYYTYTITLNPELSLSWPPSTDIAGVNDNTFSTDTEKEAYDLLDECNLTDTDTLVLYAKTKPTVNFYIWVEGEVAS